MRRRASPGCLVYQRLVLCSAYRGFGIVSVLCEYFITFLEKRKSGAEEIMSVPGYKFAKMYWKKYICGRIARSGIHTEGSGYSKKICEIVTIRTEKTWKERRNLIFIEILIIATGLSLDVFAYALCKGAMMPEIRKENMVKLCTVFTLWQVMSLILGNLVSEIPRIGKEADGVAAHWKYVSAAIFLCLGIYMIVKSCRQEVIEERKEEFISVKQIIVWACITSIDAFLAGIGFGLFETDFWLMVPIVGIVTLMAVILGVFTGYWAGCQAKSKAVTLGGCILLAGGVELIVRVL